MKTRTTLLCGALLAAMLSLPVLAQPGPGMGGMGPGMSGGGMAAPAGKRAPRDCSQSPNPDQCKARQDARRQAAEACKDRAAGPERRQCMRDQMPPRDCSKSRNPQRCEAMQKAHDSCKDKMGPERRQCMGEALKKK